MFLDQLFMCLFIKKKEKQNLQNRSQKKGDILIEYDSYAIYWIYLAKNEIVIWIKNLKIFKDILSKKESRLTIYNAIFHFKEKNICMINSS